MKLTILIKGFVSSQRRSVFMDKMSEVPKQKIQ